MKIIKVESCKGCPYKNISYSFGTDYYTLLCVKDAHKFYDWKFISRSKYTKDKLMYDIPSWCTLEEIQ